MNLNQIIAMRNNNKDFKDFKNSLKKGLNGFKGLKI